MAVSIEAAFVLIDKASKPLRDIESQAKKTDKALRGLGTTGSGGSGFGSATSQLGSFRSALDETRKTSKAMGDEIDKTAKKVKNAGDLFTRTVASIKTWGKALVANNPVLTTMAGVLGGVVGGLKGFATALPPLVWAILAAAPVIVSLAGAVGALVSSLGMAVGGGVLLGGGLLGSFAVGLGSIAAIAKPAITATQNYETAVKNLNTALASGSPTAIKARQQQLDAIAKANPGVAQLAGNLKSFQTEWKKATAPGRADFFKLAADGIQSLRDLIPTLASETNKNTAALQQSFQKILAPFLDSSQFKGFVSGLGGVFRANLPGFMTGLVNVFKGLADILKVLTPQLDRAGPAFQKFTGNFAKWAGSAGGQSTVKEMGRAFSAWLDLVKQIARIVGDVVGAGAGPGTDQIGKWADKLSGLASTLSKPAAKNSMAGFFSKSLDDVDRLWPVLKQVAADLTGIYKVWKPLGSVTQTIIKAVPSGVIAGGRPAWVGGKGVTGAVKGVQGALNLFTKSRGDTPVNPLYAFVVNQGGGGLPGGKGIRSKLKEALPSLAEGEEAFTLSAGGAATVFGLATAAGVLVPLSMDLLPKISGPQRPTVPKTASNPQGIPAAGAGTFDTLRNRFKPTRTASNPQGINPLITLGSTSGIHYLPASHYNPPTPGMPPILPSATPGIMPTLPAPASAASKVFAGVLAAVTQQLGPGFNIPIARALDKAEGDFATMASKSGDSLSTILSTATSTSDQISKTLPKDSAATNQAVAQNYAIAAADVQVSMNKHVIAVSTAMSAIAALMAKAFEALGIKSGVAKSLAGAGYSLGDINKTISSGAASGLTAGTGGNASTTGSGSYQYATGGRLPGKPRGDHLPLYGRGGKLMGIADGGELVVNRHTEARADKLLASHGTRLSDLVSNETKPHFARGGRMSNTRMFQMGGAIPYSGLEGLWDSAGGPPNLAPLMAAIAMAESGGRNVKQAGQPFATTGWGLWQITPGGPQYLDPATNAAEAVSKYRSQGLRAWTTYTSGAYRQFMHGNVPPGAYTGGGGMAVPVLQPPTVAGSGAVVAYGQQVINRITQGANQYLQANAPMAGITGGAGGPGPTGGPTGVGTYKGIPMANWVIASLQYAASKGVSPQPTSGYRTEAHSAALGFPHDEHTFPGPYPHGAVDFGGMYDPPAYPKKMAVVNATRDFKWPLLAPIGFHDDGHASGTGHAFGGRLPWFAAGADFIAKRPQVIGVGDAPGGERVTITPQGGRAGQGLYVEIHKIEVHRKGDIQKIVDEELAALATTIERHT